METGWIFLITNIIAYLLICLIGLIILLVFNNILILELGFFGLTGSCLVTLIVFLMYKIFVD